MYPRNLNGLFQQPIAMSSTQAQHSPWCPACHATCHASWRRAAAAANATWRNAAEPLIATAAADSAAEPCRIQGMPSGNVLHLLLNMAIEVVDLP